MHNSNEQVHVIHERFINTLDADLTKQLSKSMSVADADELATVLTMAYELALNVKDASDEFRLGGFGPDSHRGAAIIKSSDDEAHALASAISKIAKGGV